MCTTKKLLALWGVALAGVLLVRGVSAQPPQMQTITTPDGKTIHVPAGVNVTPEMMERMRSRYARPGSGPHPGKPEEKKEDDEKKEEKEEDKDKQKEEDKKDEATSEKAPEPVTRDSAPPKPADPKELEVRPDKETGLVEFNFVGQKWLDVLEWLALISDMSLDWQELPGDYLNLTTQRAYTVPETRDLINSHLLRRGYTLLSQGEVLSVVKIEKLDPSMVPRVQPEDLEKRDPHEYVKVSFTLDWLLAETAVKELEAMKSPNGKLTALTATNRVEAMDAVVNLLQIYQMLREEQSSSGEEGLIRVFTLKHSLAEEVVEQLNELLGIEGKSSGPAKPMTPDQMRAAAEAAKRAAEAAKKGGAPPKPKAEVYLVANKRMNSILANAPPDKMAIIEQAIEALDVPKDYTGSRDRSMLRMQVYFLQSIEPEPLIKTLRELGDLDFDTRLEADDENNAIIAYASVADQVIIASVIEKLDAGGRRAQVIQLEQLRAESVVRTIDFMMGGGRNEEEDNRSRSGRSYSPFDYFRSRSYSSRRSDSEHADQFRVDADVKNNRLLLWCNDFELGKVQDLLESLRENQTHQASDPNTVQVHRLVTLDPEPFVETLKRMETLDFHTTLEVDEENKSIIAYASEEDHAKIRELISKLDGSQRSIEVIPLRNLEADYVAGTISYIMAGKEEKQQSGYSRTYYYYDFYGPASSGRGRETKEDEFRVDADLEYNRLLVWANEVELEEVMNLLVKLGEIPPEGGNTSTIRVLDLMPGPEREKLLERIRTVWPSLAPNELLAPSGESKKEEDQEAGEEKPEDKATPAETRATTAADASVPADAPRVDDAASVTTGVARPQPARAVFRFAQLETANAEENTESQASPDADESLQEQSTVGEASERSGEPLPEKNAEPKPSEASQGQESKQAEHAEVVQEPKEQPAASGDSAAKDRPRPDQAPPAAAPIEAAAVPRPISIAEAPDGRLIITSEDTKALDQLEELIGRLAPPRKDYYVFKLQYAEAYWVSWNLKDFFEEEDEGDRSSSRYYDWYWGYPSSSGTKDTSRRLSKRRPLRFISDDDTNTILVQGATPEQLATIDELIKLYDQPPSTEAESARKTEVFQIQYSKADVVAEAIKEVYRDLLSDRDKALSNRPEQARTESRYSYTYILGDEGGERKSPKWKGYLSIGIDTLSNTLIVSAPEFLFRDIERLIEDLDEAAKPSDAVQVLHLGQGVSASAVSETLSKVLSEAGGKRAGRSTAENRGEGGPNSSGSRRTRSGD